MAETLSVRREDQIFAAGAALAIQDWQSEIRRETPFIEAIGNISGIVLANTATSTNDPQNSEFLRARAGYTKVTAYLNGRSELSVMLGEDAVAKMDELVGASLREEAVV